MNYIIYIIIIGGIIFIGTKILSKFKFPKVNSIAVFTGAVKTGKSAVSLSFAISKYKKVHRQWTLKYYLTKILNIFKKKKLSLPEEPYFYSNIKLRNIRYVPLTQEHLLRKKRFHFKSIVFIDEAGLVADSQLIRDGYINGQLLLFFKLFGHSTHGGICVLNSQAITDLHYALKRVVSEYFYIHHITRYIPFLTIALIREERYAEDGTAVNNYAEDVENTLKRVIFRKSVFKKYDYCCFSAFTDELETDKKYNIKLYSKKDSLKMNNICSFRKEFKNLGAEDRGFIDEKKDS